MEPQRIEIIAPTARAFERMKDVLFRPFDIGKWFVLGFTAWLATLLDGSGSGGGSYDDSSGSGEGGDGNDTFSEFVTQARDWIAENMTIILTVGSIIVGIVLVVLVVLAWLQSRGKFMFLDNIIRNRALVSLPWREYRAEANALFGWMIAYGIVVILLFGLNLLGFAFVSWPMLMEETFDPAKLPILIGLGLILLLLVLLVAYVSFLLESFVIPIMYRHRVGPMAAWSRVFELHARAPISFVLFFLWSAVLNLVAAVAILALVLATCCLAVIVLIIPYLGTVLLLPVLVFFRALGPEFLAQFGEEFDLDAIPTEEGTPMAHS